MSRAAGNVLRGTLSALAGIAALFVAQYAWVSATNFSGYDEWLFVSLSSRGIMTYPYENRPVVYLWHLPPAVLWPYSFKAYYAAHGLYLLGIGWLSFALVRRLVPWSVPLAFLAGAFAAIWAPGDHARLNALALTGYSGHTLGAMLAVVLFVESWVRRSVPLLAVGMVLALVSARGTEAAVPLLVGAPLLLWFLPRSESRRTWLWILAWESVVVAAGLVALWPVVFPSATVSRQHALGLDLRPTAVADRLLRQFACHVLPLVTVKMRELAHPAVPLMAAISWLFFRLVTAASPLMGGREHRRPLAQLLTLGLVMAFLGYSAFSLTGSLALPVRTEFLSGPGIALALASGVFLASTYVTPRWRPVAGGALMAWVVSVAMGRTLSMQHDWSVWGTYPAQHAVLSQLTALAPDLKPNTLVLLLDDRLAFKATYTFRHAVSYLYQGRAVGVAWGANDFLYPSRFGAEGVSTEPMAVIRGPWRSPPAFHRYDEMIVVDVRPDGRLMLLDQWPSGALPLPAGATYDPRPRILRPERLPPERGILRP